MEDFFLPVLSHFQNENFWTASAGALRYRVTPREEGLAAEVWEGPWRYEDSRLPEAGRAAAGPGIKRTQTQRDGGCAK